MRLGWGVCEPGAGAREGRAAQAHPVGSHSVSASQGCGAGRSRVGGVARVTAPPPAGTAGVMVSLSRILTKLLLPDERAGTLIFFLVSAGLELLCFLLHLLVRGSRFVLYHTARPRPSRTAGYRVHHDVAAEDVHFVSREVGGGSREARHGRRPVPAELLQPRPAVAVVSGSSSSCGPRLLPTGPPSSCGPRFHPLVTPHT